MGGASAYIDHADAIGSTTMETDPSGAVDWDAVNGPWGQAWQQTGTRQSQVFAGMDWQVNDPLMPSATREYNDGLGRWMTPDPGNAGSDLGNSQSWDMYSYVGDNPISRNDPSGLSYCKNGPNGFDLSSCVSDGAGADPDLWGLRSAKLSDRVAGTSGFEAGGASVKGAAASRAKS